MASTSTDRITGLGGAAALKVPVRVATTAAITLSGLQSIDGVTVVADDRVLVKNQSDTTANGIYVAASGSWTRAQDFDGARDATDGTYVYVRAGTTNGGYFARLSGTNPIVIGSSAQTWTMVNGALGTVTALATLLLGEATEAGWLTRLGFSAFFQTLIASSTAAALRALLGAVGLTGNETIAGDKTFSGALAAQGLVKFTGTISPTQISSDQNDYAPTDHATAYRFRVTTDAVRKLTGLSGGVEGREVVIENVGSNPLVVTDDDAASTAANRFALPNNVLLLGDTSINLRYDGTSSRWRCVGQPPFRPSVVVLENQQSAGTHGGGLSSGAFATLTLNTEVSDPDGLCTLSSNVGEFAAGTWEFEWTATSHRTDDFQSRLYDVTGSAVAASGLSAHGDNTGTGSAISTGFYRTSFTSARQFRLEGRPSTTQSSTGQGRAVNLGETERYTRLKATRVAP